MHADIFSFLKNLYCVQKDDMVYMVGKKRVSTVCGLEVMQERRSSGGHFVKLHGCNARHYCHPTHPPRAHGYHGYPLSRQLVVKRSATCRSINLNDTLRVVTRSFRRRRSHARSEVSPRNGREMDQRTDDR